MPFDADRPAVEAARRDPAAFEPLYRKYVAHIYSLALYETRDPHAAEDVTEQVFLRALAALPRFREQGEGDGSTFRVWLYTIARHVIANERRSRRRHPAELHRRGARAAGARTTRPPGRRAASRPSAPGRPCGRCRRSAARPSSCASSTSSRAREIGQIMGKSEGAVRVLIHRALDSVRRQLAS